MIRSRCLIFPLLLNILLPNAAMFQGRDVVISAEPDGTAQITLANGEKTKIQKESGQVRISDPKKASNGTVGWLADYNVDGVSYPIPLTLIIWRAGKTVRRFTTEQS